ncbi:MAG: hypothetical protein CMJ50_01555 [Planctomycetaceae bacterium]|jgi:hypothetical protein|nr:hypothetical protein [Planctomycetaceae bacterium]
MKTSMNLRTTLATSIAFLMCGLAGAPAQSAELDTFGGFTDVKGEKTGFFHAEKMDGRWWMVTPEGHGFFGIGISHPLTDMSRAAVISGYGSDQKKWMTDSVSKMRDLGYNCVWTGPQTTDRNRSRWVEEDTAERIYTEQRYPHAIHVPFIKHMVELKPGEIRPDVFSDEYKNHVRELVADKVVPKKDDPWVIGWFYGFGSFMKDFEWINQTLAREPGSPGRKRLIEVLEERYGSDIEELNRVYGTEFASFKDFHKSGRIAYPSWVTFAKWNPARMPMAPVDLVKFEDAEALFGDIAEQVYAFTHDEIRKHDTNHMILGSYVKSDTYTLDIWKRLAPYIDLVAPQDFNSRLRKTRRFLLFISTMRWTSQSALPSSKRWRFRSTTRHRRPGPSVRWRRMLLR